MHVHIKNDGTTTTVEMENPSMGEPYQTVTVESGKQITLVLPTAHEESDIQVVEPEATDETPDAGEASSGQAASTGEGAQEEPDDEDVEDVEDASEEADGE